MVIVQHSFLDAKLCRKCKEWKSHDQFYPSNANKDRLQGYCKICARGCVDKSMQRETYKARRRILGAIYAQSYRNTARGRNVLREGGRKYHRKNPNLSRITSLNYLARKAKAEGSFTVKEWRALCEFYNHKCLCCGEQKPLAADHVIPLSKGGRNSIDNIQPLCRECNSTKGTKSIDYRISFST